MHPLYSVAQIRGIERAAAAQLPPGSLMQRAGQAAANAALALLEGSSGPVLVLAGPGNNGGDALEAAANLCQAGIDVALVHVPGAARSPEAAHALARAQAGDVRFIDTLDAEPGWVLAIDGLFGIGLGRPLEGRARELVLAVSGAGRPVLALDVPSGLDADTGAVIGPNGVAMEASHTLTFIGDKPGLHTCEGRDHAGAVQVAPLDIAPALFPRADASLNARALFGAHLAPRRHASHKGSFGDVAVVGAAHGMVGAAVLAARAALFSGAGRVFAATIDPGPLYDPLHPEIMFRDAAGFANSGATLVLGPGMGDSALAMQVLAKALAGGAALVLDADALNLIAASIDLQERLSRRSAPAILTPHPLEAARLLGVTAPVVQHDRLAAARELAARFQAIVVLKGSGSVIAGPDGAAVVTPPGNPGLAQGGTAWEAALGAVWLHGAAADWLVEHGIGPRGLTAGELPAAIRQLMR